MKVIGVNVKFNKRFRILITVAVLLTQFISVSAERSVRGVWVPDPQYTNVLTSYQNVKNFVSLLDSLHFNAIFVVSYAHGKTIYPSNVLINNGRYAHIDSTNMLSPYSKSYNSPFESPTADPVKDLIREAHKHKIKVFFWYEFGFMADIKPVNAENNPLLAKNPDWLGVGNDGKPANYNNQDYYFNAYHPDVQNFLIELITEGISKYPDVDGIQGDDRLPAMCINSGYDQYTSSLYLTEKNRTPPQNYKDSAWIRWRLDLLNKFGADLYSRIKGVNKKIMVSFAPNPYPWSKDNLLQEWPQWVSGGICDLLAVQCYRRDSLSFANTVQQVKGNIKPDAKKNQLFAPGILLMVNGKLADPQVVKMQMQSIRHLNVNGEIFFYNEGLYNKSIQVIIKEFYKRKSKFPEK